MLIRQLFEGCEWHAGYSHRNQPPRGGAGEITSVGSGQYGDHTKRGSSKKVASDSRIDWSAGFPSKLDVKSLHLVVSPPHK